MIDLSQIVFLDLDGVKDACIRRPVERGQ
jgi:hypothetical protein